MAAEFVDFVDSEVEENSDSSEIKFDFEDPQEFETAAGKMKITAEEKKLFYKICQENELTVFTRNEKVNYVREKLREYRKKCDILLLKWAIHL